MKPVRLEFVSTKMGPRQRLFGHAPARTSAALALLLAGTLAAGAAVAWLAWQTEGELTGARESLQAVQRQKGQQPAKEAEAARLLLTPQQRQAWSQVVRQLNTPWAALLDALEAGTPDDVALVSIEPDARQGSVRLQVEAKTLDTLLAYAKDLNAVAVFDSVSLIKHETNEQDSNRPVRLSLDIRLRTRQALAPIAADGAAR